MSTIHNIARKYKGGILVDSSPGHGTTFEIFFPIARTSTQNRLSPSTTHLSPQSQNRIRESLPHSSVPHKQATTQGAPTSVLQPSATKNSVNGRPRVWVCEPNKILERSVRTTLETKGFDVESPQEDQDSIDANTWQKDFKAVLLPQELAQKDGFKAVNQLANEYPDCKLILTHGVMDDQFELGPLNDRVCFLQSPYSLNRLLRELGV